MDGHRANGDVVVGARDALAVSWTAGGVQELVDLVASDLRRPLGIDDPVLAAIAYSAQPDEVDEVRRTSVLTRGTSAEVAAWLFAQGIGGLDAPTRIPSNPALQMQARICVPLRSNRALLGYLWLLDEPKRISDEEIARACELAVEIAAALEQERLEEDRRKAAEAELLGALIAGAPVADLGDGLLAMAAAYSVMVFRVDERIASRGRLAEAVDLMRTSVPPHHMLSLIAGGEATVVVATDEPADEPKARAAAMLEGAFKLSPDGDRGVRAGISAPRRDIHELDAAHQEASWAASCADRERAVVDWEELGAYRTILPLIGEQPIEALLPEAVMRLLGAKDGEALLGTLETYLEHAGDSRHTAEALELHRSSLWQRLHRIEEVAEVDLRSGEVRLELHLGLRLWRLSRAASLAIQT